ncbi:MAG: ATP-binding cassette domain-containing protein [Gammaproteobacteria bacterium]|nr:ATP-binding cassette domain-containing protein [Gammaproteobacteria bacterium]
MITLNNAVLQRGPKLLLDEANLIIHSAQKVGIIGRNGSGKTSLFTCLMGKLQLDQGSLGMPENLRISYMHQETGGSTRSAVEFVIDGDRHYRTLEQQLVQADAADDQNEVARLHGELDILDGYTVKYRAEQLLSGLGFKPQDFNNSVSSFSGGWRVRLNLAAALMCPSDLLLLDEPTNHLDLEATLWLEQWLIQYPGTLLMISHDREFLDKIVKYVVSFENRKLQLYKGNYSAYEKQRGERLALERALFEKQRRRRAEIESFVARFKAKASKAKQAQSRLKELQRMEEIVLAHIDSPFRLRLPEPDYLPDYLLGLSRVSIGFTTPLVTDINFNIQASSRIGLLGFNGSGKSTLLKVLAGEMKPLSGEVTAAKRLRVGYFAQHQVDVLDSDSTPLKLLQGVSADRTEQELRDYLGGFDFKGDRAEFTIGSFSGGEKARLGLAMIAWQKPNLLLLDEPTNHLDLEMRHALTVALQAYSGAMIIISHDRHLLSNTVDNFYSIHNGSLTAFDGDLNDYERWLQANGNSDMPSVDSDAAARRLDRKMQRQRSAARREQLAPLKKQIATVEKQVEILNKGLLKINDLLANPDLYEDQNKAKLNDLLREQGSKKVELETLEEKWFSLHEEIELAEG